MRLPGKGLPLHRSDSSSFDDTAADLPLREQRSLVDERRTVVERDLFAASQPSSDVEMSGGVTIGISIWLIAAVALVAGIVIGFASGYTAGQRSVTIVAAPSESDLDEPRPAPTTAQPEAPASTQTFTEGAVTEPLRVDPDPIVAAPAPPPAVRERQPVDRAPQAQRPAPVQPAASGQGSLQILSRPSGAQVLVDGRVVGRTPLVIAGVRSGSHDVQLELAGFRRWATSVNVTPGARTRVAASLEQ